MNNCEDYDHDGRCDNCGRKFQEPDIQRCWNGDAMEELLKRIKWCAGLPDNEIREELDKLISKYE